VANLIVDSGKHRGRELKLAVGHTLIGREKQCAIRLATPDVSRTHCRLTVSAGAEGEVVTAEDLGSRNGTFVNGRAIDAPTALRAGDTLRVGPVQFVLPDPDTATESEIVNWLVPPPAPGVVADDEPTQVSGGSAKNADGDSQAGGDSEAATTLPPEPDESEYPPAAEPADDAVREAAAIIRAHHAALAK